jgi:hypothetical protein
MLLHSESQQTRSTKNRDYWSMALAVTSLVSFWVVGVGIQAVTSKVQDESPRIGYVYTYYAMGATVVALFVALTILFYGSSLRIKISTLVVALMLTAVGSCQLTINWQLMDKMNASLEPNRALLDAFSSQTDIPHRCQALINWTNGGWPPYYEEGMTNGLQAAYLHYHGEKFCPNFVMPMP